MGHPVSIAFASPLVGEPEDVALVFDGSLEGLLSAIFFAYSQHIHPSDVVEAKGLQPRLGQKVFEVPTNIEAALRVQKGICLRCGPAIFEALKYSSLADDPAVGTIIYRFIRYAFEKNKVLDCSDCSQKMKCGGLCRRTQKRSALNDSTHPSVAPFIAANRSVANERQKLMQFLRFEHMEGDLWFARCNPKASVVPLVMDWFAARFNTQAFLIFDELHHIAGVYEGRQWYLVKTDNLSLPERTPDEQLMSRAWKRFYKTIAVESRYNPELRQHFMPKRLWRNIIEMQEEIPPRVSGGAEPAANSLPMGTGLAGCQRF